ncbi:MAG: ArsR/SmtB family transcription factor [Promethearchaeota archaeon]
MVKEQEDKITDTRARKKKMIDTLAKCYDNRDPEAHYNNLVDIGQKASNNGEIQALVKIFEAIGKKDRLVILDVLKEKDRCVCELEAIMDKTQPTITSQLKTLEAANLIRGWKSGKFTHYSLVKPTWDRFKKDLDEWMETITNWFGYLDD